MAMNSSSHTQNQHYPHLFFFPTSTSFFFFSIVAIFLLQLLIIYPFATPRELLFEEKTRLGSRPPSCHNKCNQCHPCMAVQVPTFPGQARVEPGHIKPGSDKKDELGTLVDSSMAYSNYKAMGWKCLCKDHFFNP